MGILTAQIKSKLPTVNYRLKVPLLPLKPDSWPIKKASDYFNISEYLVRKTTEIKNQHGILTLPGFKSRKLISEKTIELVISFYEDDEWSRMMPGRKDYVSITQCT